VGEGSEHAGFIGRTDELARLTEALGRAADGHGSTVVVGGEAGIGKTRMLEVFAASARESQAQVLSGACIQFEGHGLAFAPFVEALRGLLRPVERARLPAFLGPARRDLARLLPELADERGVADHDRDLDRTGQPGLFEVVLAVIERLSRTTPVVLIVEDVQWADHDTRDLLGFLVRHLRTSRVLTILSTRTGDADHDGRSAQFLAELERDPWVGRIELAALSRSEIGQLVTANWGHRPSGEALDDIVARSNGNPFYAEQLVAIGPRADGGHELPPLLRDVLKARLAELPPGVRDVVGAIAAAAGRVDDSDLVDLLGVEPRALTGALRTAIAAGVLVTVEDGEDRSGYAFRHALLKEVAYADLLPGERLRLHARFAERLAARRSAGLPVDASDLAFHLDRAGRVDAAVAALVEAGGVAEHAYAFGRARRFYERALVLWGTATMVSTVSADRALVLQRAAECALLTGAYDEAIQHGQAAIVAAKELTPPDPLRVGQLQDRLRWYLWNSGDRAAASAAVEEALAEVPAHPPSAARARVLAQDAGLRMDSGDLVGAMRSARAALEIARPVGAAAEEAFAGGILGWCQAVSGETDAGIATFRSGLAIAVRLGTPEGISLGYANLAALLDRIGRTHEALEAAMDDYRNTRELGVSRTYGGLLLGHAAKALFDLGRWGQAASVAADGLELDPVGRAAIDLHLAIARIAGSQGRLPEGILELHRARELAEFSGQAVPYGPALLAIDAELARAEGRFADVRTALERGIAFVAGDRPIDPALGWLAATGLRVQADAARIARAQHDDAALGLARELATRIMAIVERASGGQVAADVRADAMLALCRAERHRVDGPADPSDWLEVVRRWDALDRPFQAAYARFRLGEAILGSRRSRDEAALALREAHRVTESLDATPLQGEIELLCRHARIDLDPIGAAPDSAPPDPADPASGLGLTKREAEVIGLVAAGWSNQQIADALFITRKTASVHVSNILGKLGVGNRIEAAAIAQRLGIGRDVPLPIR
jgi:DNA-binding CsgD family transcriptional regulator/tetratricopeptide (TPR) repeat protein